MSSLIITLIAIALSIAIAITMYMNSTFLADRRAEAATVQLANQANQIWGASALYYTEKGTWPDTAAQLVSGHYLVSAPQPPDLSAADSGMVTHAMAAVQPWTLIKNTDGTLAYIVLPDALEATYCITANLTSRGEPVKNITEMVKAGIAVIYRKNKVAGSDANGAAPRYTKEARSLPALPTQFNSQLVYQCVKGTAASKAGSYYWMTPKFAELSTPDPDEVGDPGDTVDPSNPTTPPARCTAVQVWNASRGVFTTCGVGDLTDAGPHDPAHPARPDPTPDPYVPPEPGPFTVHTLTVTFAPGVTVPSTLTLTDGSFSGPTGSIGTFHVAGGLPLTHSIETTMAGDGAATPHDSNGDPDIDCEEQFFPTSCP